MAKKTGPPLSDASGDAPAPSSPAARPVERESRRKGPADRPIFTPEELEQPGLPPDVAAESAQIMVEVLGDDRSGTLDPQAVDQALREAASGNPDGARAIRILGKNEAAPTSPPEDVQRARETWEPQEIIDDLRRVFRRIARQVIGREDLLVQTLYALLTREHQLIFSRAGMAKSLYAATVFGQFQGARTFSMQLTKGTPEEGLVGAIDIEELKRGNIIHNVHGTLVDARFAFLDEIFDSNDVALRSLLGILNERLFRKGKQTVEAVLHTAIATSNYVRASEVTEAFIDRFPFRATLLPSDDPYEALRIDQAYATTTGRVVLPPPRQLVSFEQLEFLNDIVEGRVQGREITAPPHVLFLKFAVIKEFVRRVNAARTSAPAVGQGPKQRKPDLYVSPRTIAKTRDILNASALVRGRTDLSIDDLNDLRYMICTIGDEEQQERHFEDALSAVTGSISHGDLQTIDLIMEAHALFEAIMDRKERGVVLQPSVVERIKLFFHLTSLGDLTFGRVRESVARLKPVHPLVAQLQQSVLARFDREIDRSAGRRADRPLF